MSAVLIALIEEFGPIVLRWGLANLPTFIAWVEASQKAGTLDADLTRLVTVIQGIARIVGPITSISDLADMLGSIQPQAATVDSPAMAHADRGGNTRGR